MYHVSQVTASYSLQHDVLGLPWVGSASREGNLPASAPIHPDKPSVKGHGEMEMKICNTSYHYTDSSFIVVALLLEIETIK